MKFWISRSSTPDSLTPPCEGAKLAPHIIRKKDWRIEILNLKELMYLFDSYGDLLITTDPDSGGLAIIINDTEHWTESLLDSTPRSTGEPK
jgi:hypothetical protein